MLKTFEIRNFPTNLKRVETFRHTLDPIHQLTFLLVRINEAGIFMPVIISRRSLPIAVPYFIVASIVTFIVSSHVGFIVLVVLVADT